MWCFSLRGKLDYHIWPLPSAQINSCAPFFLMYFNFVVLLRHRSQIAYYLSNWMSNLHLILLTLCELCCHFIVYNCSHGSPPFAASAVTNRTSIISGLQYVFQTMPHLIFFGNSVGSHHKLYLFFFMQNFSHMPIFLCKSACHYLDQLWCVSVAHYCGIVLFRWLTIKASFK